jgi:hypothetical protein
MAVFVVVLIGIGVAAESNHGGWGTLAALVASLFVICTQAICEAKKDKATSTEKDL